MNKKKLVKRSLLALTLAVVGGVIAYSRTPKVETTDEASR